MRVKKTVNISHPDFPKYLEKFYQISECYDKLEEAEMAKYPVRHNTKDHPSEAVLGPARRKRNADTKALQKEYAYLFTEYPREYAYLFAEDSSEKDIRRDLKSHCEHKKSADESHPDFPEYKEKFDEIWNAYEGLKKDEVAKYWPRREFPSGEKLRAEVIKRNAKIKALKKEYDYLFTVKVEVED